MTWFAFKGYNNGKAIDLAGSQEKEAVSLGFHGYGTEQLAETQPNSVSLFQKLFVNAFIADYNMAVKQGSQPGGPNANILNPATAVKAGVQGDVNSLLSGLHIGGLSDIGDFFHRLTEKETWTRVAEVGIGVILLYVGLKAVTTPSGQQVAKQTVKKTAKNTASLFAKTPVGKARTVRKAGKTRAQRIVYRRDVRQRTGNELMRIKRKRGLAP